MAKQIRRIGKNKKSSYVPITYTDKCDVEGRIEKYKASLPIYSVKEDWANFSAKVNSNWEKAVEYDEQEKCLHIYLKDYFFNQDYRARRDSSYSLTEEELVGKVQLHGEDFVRYFENGRSCSDDSTIQSC